VRCSELPETLPPTCCCSLARSASPTLPKLHRRRSQPARHAAITLLSPYPIRVVSSSCCGRYGIPDNASVASTRSGRLGDGDCRAAQAPLRAGREPSETRQVLISKSYRIRPLWVFDPAATKCTLPVNSGEAHLLQLKWSDGTKLHRRSGAASLCRNQAIAIHLFQLAY
jgi:hypothetical protein